MAVTILRLILLGLITIFIYYLKSYIKSNRAIEKSFRSIYSKAEDRYSKRKAENEKIYFEEGNKENKSFFYNLDLIIERSGLRKKFSFLSTEIFILLTIILSLVGYLIGVTLNGVVLGTIIVTVIIVSLYGILYILSGINYEKIDQEIIPFINLLENYSGSNSDIVDIMGSVYPYLNNPLRSYIEEFYNEATFTGDNQRAFRNLENKIESVRLKAVIRNIEICSRHEANYDVIIKDERRSLRSYSKAKKRKKSIVNKGRGDIITSLIMSGFILMMFIPLSPNLLDNLLNSTIGSLILVYCTIVLGICAWNFIAFDKGENV